MLLDSAKKRPYDLGLPLLGFVAQTPSLRFVPH